MVGSSRSRRVVRRLVAAAALGATALVVIAPPAAASPGITSLVYDGDFVMTIAGSSWWVADEEGVTNAEIWFSPTPYLDADGRLDDADLSWALTTEDRRRGVVELTVDPSPTGTWYVQVVASGPGPVCICNDATSCESNVASVRNVLPDADEPSTSLRGDGLVDSARIAGRSRYETAAALSRYWTRPADVFVATGEGFADALAAGPAAAFWRAPILLAQRDALPPATATELRRLAPQRVVLVGGPAAISEAVATAIDDIVADVVRIAGADRYATAALLADYVFGDAYVLTAYVASGRAFADPIITGAAAALAYRPLLLVDGTRPLEPVVREELARLDVTNIVLVGTNDDVAVPLGELWAIAPVTRIADEDLFERSAALWDHVEPPVFEVILATSAAFADALTGTPYAALEPQSYLMLSEPTCVPGPVLAQLERLRPDHLVLLGGTAALADAVGDRAAC